MIDSVGGDAVTDWLAAEDELTSRGADLKQMAKVSLDGRLFRKVRLGQATGERSDGQEADLT